MVNRYDICSCGAPKDKRAEQCRACKDRHGATYKICTGCKLDKPLSEFRIRTRKVPLPRSRCKECESREAIARHNAKPIGTRKIATRRWEKANPDKHRAQKFRRNLKMLGLESQQVEIEKHLKNHSVCEICNKPPVKVNTRLALDHDHATGEFRGLLCENCNRGLGLFKDNLESLVKAIEYLKNAAKRHK